MHYSYAWPKIKWLIVWSTYEQWLKEHRWSTSCLFTAFALSVLFINHYLCSKWVHISHFTFALKWALRCGCHLSLIHFIVFSSCTFHNWRVTFFKKSLSLMLNLTNGWRMFYAKSYYLYFVFCLSFLQGLKSRLSISNSQQNPLIRKMCSKSKKHISGEVFFLGGGGQYLYAKTKHKMYG